MRDWFTQSQISSLLLDVAREIVSNVSAVDLDTNKEILLLCFETSDGGGEPDLVFNVSKYKLFI